MMAIMFLSLIKWPDRRNLCFHKGIFVAQEMGLIFCGGRIHNVSIETVFLFSLVIYKALIRLVKCTKGKKISYC